MALAYVTLTGNLGAGALGALATFTPSAWLTDAADQELLPPEPVTAHLSATGTFSVSLLATDNTAPTPAGWQWSGLITGIPNVAAHSFTFKLQAGPAAFTATNASPCVFTATAPAGQPWETGQTVTLSGSLPAGFSSATTYYLVNVTTGTFELAATAGGTPVNSTSTGTGSATITGVDLSAVA